MSNPQETPNASSSRLDSGEHHDVTELHAAVLREKPDPVEGFEPVNLWMVAGIAGLLFWGGAYLTQYSGRFEAMEFSELPHGKPALVAAVAADPLAAVKRDGMIAYNAVCALCHGEDGAGKAGGSCAGRLGLGECRWTESPPAYCAPRPQGHGEGQQGRHLEPSQ